MANKIDANVGYGIILLEDPEDESVPDALLKFGTDDWLWGDFFLKHLYPEGAPSELKISGHYLRGHDKGHERGRYEIPVLTIEDSGYPNLSYDITTSGDNPSDLSGFLRALEERKSAWDKLIADFVRRCIEDGFNLAYTDPHPILYISWDWMGH